MPLPLAAALALGSAAIGGIQSGISAFGMKDARKRAEEGIESTPTYTASPEAAAFLQAAKQRIGTGRGGNVTQIAKEGVQTAAQRAVRAALLSGKASGLGLIGAIQLGEKKGYRDIAMDEAVAEQANIARLGQATQMFNVERARQFQSEQEKQQLKANIELERLAARRAMLSQGLSGLSMGLSTAAMSSRGTKAGAQPKQSYSDVEQLSFMY